MKTLSWWAIASGLIFGLLTLAVPSILEWQVKTSLQQFDAQKMTPQLVDASMEELRPGLAITQVHSGFCIIAGVLMLKRRRIGWQIWAGLCCVPILLGAFDILRGSSIGAPILRAAWWLLVLFVSWKTVQRGSSYWKTAPSPS